MAGAYDHLPERFRKAAQFRAQVIARENKAVAILARSWKLSVKKLQVDIDKLTAKIELARINGEVVNKDWLRRQKEYRRLQSQIIQRATKYSEEVARELKTETAWAARKGATDALVITQSAFPSAVQELVTFRSLPERTVLNIAGRVAPRTPTGRILRKMGKDTADKARDVLIDGVTRGRNVRVIARELARVTNLPATRAANITYTEVFGAYRDSHDQTIKANKKILKGWVWFAQVGTACGGCLAKHGQRFTCEQSLMSHNRCHCEQVPEPKTFRELGIDIDEPENPFDSSVMRRDAERQLKGSLSDLTERFGKGKAEAIKSGKVKLDDLATVVKNKTWGDSVVETPLKNLI